MGADQDCTHTAMHAHNRRIYRLPHREDCRLEIRVWSALLLQDKVLVDSDLYGCNGLVMDDEIHSEFRGGWHLRLLSQEYAAYISKRLDQPLDKD